MASATARGSSAGGEDPLAKALRERSAICSLSNEVKAWLTIPPHTAEREQLSKELQNLEAKIFAKQKDAAFNLEKSMALQNQIKSESDAKTIELLKKELEKLPAAETFGKELDQLETEREKLLKEYWQKYFTVEWPNAASNRLRASMTSPSSYSAAENMLAMRSRTSSLANGATFAPDGSPGSPGTDAKKNGSTKRTFEVMQNGLATAFPLSQSDDDNPSARDDTENIRCNCKKSRCLKLYCECFAAKKMCELDCKCVDCANNESHRIMRDAAIKAVLERRPDAFHTKILVATVVNGPASQAIAAGATPAAAAAIAFKDGQQPVALAHVRGCSCRRTKCTKKYCVCYNTDVKCGDWCRCVECENGKVESDEPLSQPESQHSHDRLSLLAGVAL